MESKKAVSLPPHILDQTKVWQLDAAVGLALVPSVVSAALVWGGRALGILMLSLSASLLTEAAYRRFRKPSGPSSWVHTAVLAGIGALLLPPQVSWLGALAASGLVVFFKGAAGGNGSYLLSPAAASFLVVSCGQPALAVLPGPESGLAHIVLAGGMKPLSLGAPNPAALILSYLILIWARHIRWDQPFWYLLGLGVSLSLGFSKISAALLCQGLWVCLFILSDPSTLPFLRRGRHGVAALAGGAGGLFLAESPVAGLAAAGILASAMTPWLDALLRPKPPFFRAKEKGRR